MHIHKTINIQKNLTIFGTPLLIFGLMAILAKSSFFAEYPDNLAPGITFDLLISAPLVYFLLIRKTSIPKTTVVPFLIAGVILCSILLPKENQYYLGLFKTWVLPVAELSLLSFLIYKVSKAIRQFKLNKKGSPDFFTTLKNTCHEILPKQVVMPVVMEISVFYYGFVCWKRRELKKNEFSYHKANGTIALLIAILFLIAIETIVLHILLSRWSHIAAGILTLLSIYSGFQIFGFLKSILKRPISIENYRIYLRYGIMAETTIDIKDIESVELSSKDLDDNKETRKMSFLGDLESHNIIIRLKTDNELTGLYGIKRKYRNLALHVDNKIEFKSLIDNTLQNLK